MTIRRSIARETVTEFRWRQPKDELAVVHVDVGHPEHLPEERARLLGVGGNNDGGGPSEHEEPSRVARVGLKNLG